MSGREGVQQEVKRSKSEGVYSCKRILSVILTRNLCLSVDGSRRASGERDNEEIGVTAQQSYKATTLR